jgi:hypothetical protein
MPASRKIMSIVWPAFLSACALQGVVFAVVDPLELLWFGHPLAWSRQSVYTAAFFVFWGCSALASGLTVVLARSDRAEGEML